MKWERKGCKKKRKYSVSWILDATAVVAVSQHKLELSMTFHSGCLSYAPYSHVDSVRDLTTSRRDLAVRPCEICYSDYNFTAHAHTLSITQ